MEDLRALRVCIPELSAVPPAALVGRMSSNSILPIGVFGLAEGEKLAEQLRAARLSVLAVPRSEISYLKIDQTTNSAWIVEDETESREIAEQMIAEGVPVIDVEEV